MTDKTTEALKIDEAIATLELVLNDGADHGNWPLNKNCEDGLKCLVVIREALAEQDKQEPVAIVVEVDRHGDATVVSGAWQLDGGTHTFYAAQVSAKREWVDLTDGEIEEVCISLWSGGWRQKAMNDFARAVITAFKEKRNDY